MEVAQESTSEENNNKTGTETAQFRASMMQGPLWGPKGKEKRTKGTATPTSSHTTMGLRFYIEWQLLTTTTNSILDHHGCDGRAAAEQLLLSVHS